MQLDFFTHISPAVDLNAEQVENWQLCWQWKGPTVGEYCEFSSVFARDRQDKAHYVYMEPVEVLAVDGYKVTVKAVGVVPEPPTFKTKRGKRKTLEEKILAGEMPDTKWLPNPNAGTIFDVEFKDLWPWPPYMHGYDRLISPDGKQIITIRNESVAEPDVCQPSTDLAL
jgi:hypothetical protein